MGLTMLERFWTFPDDLRKKNHPETHPEVNSGSEESLLALENFSALEWERDLKMAVSVLHGGPVITEAVQKKMQFYTGI